MLNDHRIATGHCFCSECDLPFENQKSYTTHRQTETHASEFKCCNCDIFFKDVHALVAHMESRAHRKPLQQKPTESTKKKNTTMGHECNKCQKTFKSTQALEQHSKSLKHKPLSDLSCPMGKSCPQKLTSPSALLHHLENGNCRSGITRDDIYQLVQSYDDDGIIHNRLAQTPSLIPNTPLDNSSLCSDMEMVSLDASSEWSLLTPPLSEGSLGDISEQWSMLESFRGSLEGGVSIDVSSMPTLRCPLCPEKRNRFATSLALQQHMNSPAHSAKIYHCPSNLFSTSSSNTKAIQKTERHFSTLSGLSQHLESGACRGGKKTLIHCIGIIQERLQAFGLGEMRGLLLNAQG